MKHPISLLAILLAFALVVRAFPPAGPADSATHFYATWADYGGAPDSGQYSVLKQIDKTNVSRLEQAWFDQVNMIRVRSFGAADGPQTAPGKNISFVPGKLSAQGCFSLRLSVSASKTPSLMDSLQIDAGYAFALPSPSKGSNR